MKKLITLVTTALLAASAYAGEYPDISVKELKSAIAAKKAELAKVLPQDKDALVVAYCGGPTCGAYAAAAKAAKELGYKNVKHLSAGISGWKEAGAPLEK